MVDSDATRDRVPAHPQWCVGTDDCGIHLSRPDDVPATAGGYRATDNGAEFPRVETAAALTEAGTPSVHLALYDPTGPDGPRWAAALMTVAEFEALLVRGAEIIALARTPDTAPDPTCS